MYLKKTVVLLKISFLHPVDMFLNLYTLERVTLALFMPCWSSSGLHTNTVINGQYHEACDVPCTCYEDNGDLIKKCSLLPGI